MQGQSIWVVSDIVGKSIRLLKNRGVYQSKERSFWVGQLYKFDSLLSWIRQTHRRTRKNWADDVELAGRLKTKQSLYFRGSLIPLQRSKNSYWAQKWVIVLPSSDSPLVFLSRGDDSEHSAPEGRHQTRLFFWYCVTELYFWFITIS